MTSRYSKALPPIPTFQRYNSTLTSHSALKHGYGSFPSPGKISLDFTQRIERKLAEYNASGNIFKRWLFELTCWLVSALCMGSIIAAYLKIDGQLMVQFQPLLILINVLGKTASAALIVPTSEAIGQLKWTWFHSSNVMWDFEIFDKASRGPIGAIMLLFRTKGRSLAALGALLILLLLAIDTFLQQVVNLPGRWTLQSREGILPRATWYERTRSKVYREGYEVVPNDQEMSHIINRFSYSNGTQEVQVGKGTQSNIPLSCPTSNCTWPIYETLSVCSQCADISSYLTLTCLTHRVDWISNLTGGYKHEGSFPNMTACGYFLNATSENPVMMSGYLVEPEKSTKGEALLMRTLPLITLYDKKPSYGNGSINFKDLRNTIADVIIVSATNGSAASVYHDEPPIAQECVLTYCVQKIQSSYQWGEYHEEVLETFFNTTPGLSPWLAIPYKTNFENGTDIYYLEDIIIAPNNDPNELNHSTYGMSNASAAATVQGFVDIFPAYYTTQSESETPALRYKTWSQGPAWSRELDFNPWLAPNNVTRHLERLAAAMTNVMRSAGSRVPLQGQAWTWDIYISISWGWFAFPLTLLILSLVFLVSTIIKTSEDTETGVWKTSTMPTLIYGLPKETQQHLNSSSTWDSMQEGTKKVRIRLLPNMGWRVSGQSYLSESPKLPRRENRTPPGWV